MMNKTHILLVIALMVGIGLIGYYSYEKEGTSEGSLTILCSGAEVDSAFMVSSNPLEQGHFLAGTGCKTLYFSVNDRPNASLCDEACLENWLPYIATGTESDIDETVDFIKVEGLEGKFSTLEREDGSRQYTLNGQPLYFFSGDVLIGWTKGNRLDNGNWRIIPITVSEGVQE